jgi:hypothetical protein
MGSNFFALVSKCISFSRLHRKVIDEDVIPRMNVPLLPFGGGPSICCFLAAHFGKITLDKAV